VSDGKTCGIWSGGAAAVTGFTTSFLEYPEWGEEEEEDWDKLMSLPI
jgi:hypothetical protein